jgi:regulatory protein
MQKKHKKLNLPEIYSANEYATFLLSSRMLSSGQIREKLAKKGYTTTDTENVVKDFERLKYLDDGQFAQIFSENLKKYKNFGYFGIKKKLMERKLSSEVIDGVLSEFTIAQEKAIAKRLLEKSGAGKSPEKHYRMLQSRGFRGEVIAKVVKRGERED